MYIILKTALFAASKRFSLTGLFTYLAHFTCTTTHDVWITEGLLCNHACHVHVPTCMYIQFNCMFVMYSVHVCTQYFLFQYKVSSSELSSRTLWLSVWDWDRFGRNQFLGEIRLPLSTLDLTDSSEHYYSLQDKVPQVWTA